MRPLRWGILGCGDIAAKTFAPCLVHSPRCELTAVCRRDAKRAEEFARRFHVPNWHTDEQVLLDRDDVDAVVVATPPDSHCRQVTAAAARGKHVLVEKPMALTLDECERMRDACARAGVRLGVAYRRRLFPQVTRAGEMLAAGAVGRITLVRAHYSGWMAAEPGNAWRVDPAVGGGGAMMDMACHRLEVMLNLGGPASEVMAMVETVAHPWPVDDTGCLLLRFESGALGIHSTTLTSPPRHDYVEVNGTRGKLILDPMEHWADHLRLVTSEGEERVAVEPVSAAFQDLAMIEDFTAAVWDGRDPICGAAPALRTQAVIAAAYESARIGSAVRL